MKKRIALYWFVIGVFANAQEASVTGTPEEFLTHRLNEIYKEGHIKGYGIALIDRTGTRYEKGFGFADTQKKIPYSHQTLQNIGSVSKTLIGVALMKAQEQNKLHLDDPINDYLPFQIVNPFFPEVQITIRHLATHTSTIKDTKHYDDKVYVILDTSALRKPVVKTLGENFQTPQNRVTMRTFFNNLLTPSGSWYRKRNYLKKKPGTTFEYSNVAAALAAYIIERATGESYDAYTTHYILKPLGMDASGWSLETIERGNHSMLYTGEGAVIPFYTLVTYPDGGLISSLSDMGNYLVELNKAFVGEGTLLSVASYKELFKQQLMASHFKDRGTDNPLDDEFNAGIFMGFTPTGNVGHTGSDPGVFTYMFFDPKTGIGRMVFANTSITAESWEKQVAPIEEVMDQYQRLIRN